jgi:polyisoprenoid-binding protein YceI
MSRYAWLALPVLLLTTQVHAQTVDWNADPAHSHVGFTARHLGFSKVQGQLKKFAVTTLKADAKTGHITALEATADATTVNTDNDKRDADLRSDHFFYVEKFPQLKLKLKSIKWNGEEFTAKVDLTIRDVTKEVTFKGELFGVHEVDFGRGKHLRAGYEATAKINRKDFGLNFNGVAEGLSIVADDVEIDLTMEMSYTPTP